MSRRAAFMKSSQQQAADASAAKRIAFSHPAAPAPGLKPPAQDKPSEPQPPKSK